MKTMKDLDQYNFYEFLKSTDDSTKKYVLNNSELLNKISINVRYIRKIILSLSNDSKIEILSNKELIKQFRLTSFDIAELIADIKNDEIKYQFAKDYELSEYETSQVIQSLSDEKKKDILLKDKHGLGYRYIVDIISSFGLNAMIEFVNNEQIFLQGKGIKPFHFIQKMSYEKQLEIAENIDKLNLPEGEKRRIFASLKNETKQAIDFESVDKKYRYLLGIESSEEIQLGDKIIPKLGEDLTQYKDLDELLSINPLQMIKSDEDREHLLKLCEICPNLQIRDNLSIGISSGKEYIQGEEWISSVLNDIHPEWTDVQKMAHIDTAIGKRISYSPEFGTEVEKTEDVRALWKIIVKGYGVCNGIAQVEKYLLQRVGIESELVSGQHHSFLKVKNIAIPTQCGIVQGDTLVDPTWNLTASRFGAMPQHFCKSYEELRKVDIDEAGKDHRCHKNEGLEQIKTINMDIGSLRDLYKSIGIANEDGEFPIGELIVQARKIDETSNDIKSNIKSKFELLKKWCPEFATCQNSAITVIKDILFETNEYFDFKKCIASRVYEKTDYEKKAVLYICVELEGAEKLFFYADKEIGEFVQLSQQEFETKFECYDKDLEKNQVSAEEGR